VFGVRKYVNGRYSDAQQLYGDYQSSAVHTGQGQQNKIAVVASGSGMTFYVNEQQIAQVQDSSYTSGGLALVAALNDNNDHATDVAYSNARLWTL
jgi:hypothetical protein